MMERELFDDIVAARIMEYMPPLYANYSPTIQQINKVNEIKTALMLLPDEKVCTSSPMIYMEDMYDLFCENEDLDETLRYIANIFMNNIFVPFENSEALFDFKNLKDRVVMQLINTERNVELLETLPHTDIINMSVIYRVIMQFCDDGGFDSILVNDSVLEEMEVSVEDVHKLAIKNTKRIFEPVILALSAKALMVSNKYQTFGSSSMLIHDVMNEVGRKLESDALYIIPCSIHEFIVTQADGTDLESLVAMLAEGNREFTRECDILSDSIYRYDLAGQKLSKAASC